MLCPNCLTVNPPDARHCRRCTTPLGGSTDLPTAELVQANRASRLLAWVIDAPFSPLGILIAMNPPGPLESEVVVGGLLVGAVIGMGYQIKFLTQDGQTIGKKAVGLRIIKIETGQNGGFFTNVVMRYIVNWMLWLIPPYAIVDSLFVFLNERRCVHDYIAGTKVVLS